jgi:hypothetical protein
MALLMAQSGKESVKVAVAGLRWRAMVAVDRASALVPATALRTALIGDELIADICDRHNL